MVNTRSTPRPVCAVVGVGPGNGAAFAHRFAAKGYSVALIARSGTTIDKLATELPGARAYACDVTDAPAVARTFEKIRSDLGAVEVLVYNAGSAEWGTIETLSPAAFESAWRTNTLGAFLTSQQVVPAMKAAHRGSIIFIGATASRRGTPRATGFASAKAAQRSFAESLAKTLWPEGIHVGLVIIDGVVDTPRTRQMMPGKPESFFVKPEDVANIVFQLTRQPPSAWSFEVDARPFAETW